MGVTCHTRSCRYDSYDVADVDAKDKYAFGRGIPLNLRDTDKLARYKTRKSTLY